MILQFSGFRFDAAQQVLYKNDEVVTLTANQAKILGMFLANPSQVLSKDEILSCVWKDRIVSEQVVFQNISQLRSIFSDTAIKTFPKRGYQWQLPVEPAADNALSTNSNSQNYHPAQAPSGELAMKKVMFSACAVLVLLLLAFLFYPKATERGTTHAEKSTLRQNTTNMQLIPFATRFNGQLETQLKGFNRTLTANYPVIVNTKHITADAFFNSPFMVRKDLIKQPDDLVVSGYLFEQGIAQQQQGYLLEYLVQGQYRRWQGYIQSASLEDLQHKLQSKLALLSASQFFSLSADAFTTSELSLLLGEHPEDLDIMKHLIERQLLEDTYQTASALIEQMMLYAGQQQHPIYQAYALWLKGQLLHKLRQHELAKTNLEQANEKLADAQFFALQSEVNKSLADIAAEGDDFKPIQDYLYQAASQARIANRPVQEIRAYTLLSIKASKLGLEKEKYDYLIKAKTLLADYDLDPSHYMLPFYHFALFAQTDHERETFYLKVLAQPVTPENYWVYFSVSEQLSNLYAEQNRWQEALALTDNITEPARGHFLKAKIYHKMGNQDSAVEHALESFNSARTQRIDWVGLDMAMLLLELAPVQMDDANTLMYRRFIHQHASQWWLNRHQARLRQIGITMDPYENAPEGL